MERPGTRIPAGAAAAVLALLAAAPAAGQGALRLVVDSVSDSRARTAAGDPSGRLTLMPKLEGEGLSEAKAFRLRVAAARDDTGRSLVPDEPEPTVWEESATGAGLWLRLASPARGAATVTVTGTVELWMPGRDPAAEVRIPKALARPGKPLAAQGLRDAGLALRLAPRERTPEGAVAFTGRASDLERVRSVRVVKADGTEIGTSGRQTTTEGAAATLEVFLVEPAPEGATLVLGLLTKRSVLAVPFELKEVPLP